MTEVSTLKCDECGKLRLNDSNHWLEAVKFCSAPSAEGFVAIGRVDSLPADKSKIAHLCGQECAMKWVGIKIGEL